jgi:hypothetical protein|tara:strand:+ start:137 stop:448 length:312 start_codon:yes stop_codon:yes gene_type:complete
MKTLKIIVISILLIGLCNITYAGDSTSTDPLPRHNSNNDGFGLMALGGVTLTLGAISTIPNKYHVGNGVWQIKPFHKQGPRSSAIICGVSLTITGLISAIANY